MAKTCCGKKCCSSVLIISGVLFVTAMVVCILTGVFIKLFHDTIDKNVQLKEGSETYKNWKSPTSSVYMQYFMFNVTNPDAVQNGSKPIVKQIGPFSYREVRHNIPVDFNHTSNTIVFLSQKAYVFDPATSCVSCDPVTDKIFTINMPLLIISQMIVKELNKLLSYLPKWSDKPVYDLINDELLKNEPVMEDKSVHELLWGYNDTLLAEAKYVEDRINLYLKHIGKKINITVDPFIHLQSNNTNTSSEIHTGVGNIDHLGQYVSYNHLRKLKWWGDDWANMINGTDGTMFHPFVKKNEKLFTFVSDVCRSIYLTYDSTVTVRGITLYRYYTPPELFQYTPVVKHGFCVPENQTCVPDGLLNISVCQKGAPIVVSLPHFLFANESVINEVDGLHPNKEDHATFIAVEPNTGITMKASKRIQINVAVDKVPQIRKLSKLRKLFLPVLFVNESACISEHDANKFKKSVYLPLSVINVGKYVVIGFGGLLFIVGLILLNFRKKPETTAVSHPTIQQVDAADPDDYDDRAPLTRNNYVT